eukprot:4200440-Prymnesium_polylepis.3
MQALAGAGVGTEQASRLIIREARVVLVSVLAGSHHQRLAICTAVGTHAAVNGRKAASLVAERVDLTETTFVGDLVPHQIGIERGQVTVDGLEGGAVHPEAAVVLLVAGGSDAVIEHVVRVEAAAARRTGTATGEPRNIHLPAAAHPKCPVGVVALLAPCVGVHNDVECTRS